MAVCLGKDVCFSPPFPEGGYVEFPFPERMVCLASGLVAIESLVITKEKSLHQELMHSVREGELSVASFCEQGQRHLACADDINWSALPVVPLSLKNVARLLGNC